ncbi:MULTISPECIES: AraC family transcriptional regulator [unclassified Roseovarius]|uniref:helix-turn-helix domain-containing protein n=1 Tax=unclassified Roseovarius TaxID=2614913 RepID=UPI00273F2786|nr:MULTISPECIES: AraC family transcriptional regulator [unclassified Roseovarius]
MDSTLIEMTSLGSVAIAMFGAAFCLMQTRHSRVSRSFAIFLTAIAVNNLPDAFTPLLASLPSRYASAADLITWPSSFLLAPLFWLYVFLLTSSEQQAPARLARHFALPTASVVVAIMVLASPPSIREMLFSNDPEATSAWGTVLIVAMALLQLAVFPQIALYLILTLHRLSKFRLKLRDYYSSTEKHELRWIYVIGVLGISFWLAMTLLLFGAVTYEDAPPAIVMLASLVGFLLVSALTLWGIRQRPPLAPGTDDDPSPTTSQPSGKYEKSALSAEASERLSRKLRNAMEVDHLHRDANLSLWALARHIGASSNYISQTLNEVIGESFFDFVNSYRIAEAKTLLATTNESVLNITYDVGFNARSSFYNAFKRHTGQTPTSYRKNLSQRDGVDDINGQLNDT